MQNDLIPMFLFGNFGLTCLWYYFWNAWLLVRGSVHLIARPTTYHSKANSDTDICLASSDVLKNDLIPMFLFGNFGFPCLWYYFWNAWLLVRGSVHLIARPTTYHSKANSDTDICLASSDVLNAWPPWLFSARSFSQWLNDVTQTLWACLP